ncbi:replication protein RepA [Edaphobacter aggregans]|uniref:replication protein RepA n=1 Tax=Edaphobacter aggregans TaxID=570835 RepID=UPI00068F0A86|nr:replication protein RepA [Edaphobacter aggregans]
MAADNTSILRHVRKGPTSTTGVAGEWSAPRPGAPISPERLNELIRVAQSIEDEDPWTADAVRYASRIQISLPHSNRKINQFENYVHQNGTRRLEVKPDTRYGIPYGSLPRLILLWVADEVRHKKSPLIFLGDNLSEFMEELEIVPTGGRWGSITRLRDQMLRLFNADIRFRDTGSDGEDARLFSVQKHSLWWNRPVDAAQSDLWESQILLTDALFEELLVNSSPVNMKAIKAMRRSPLELDIYCWLTYRMKYLKRPLFLSYQDLGDQFAAGYDKTNPYNLRDNLDKALWAVLKLYPACRVQPRYRQRRVEGWLLQPSPTHVPSSRNQPELPKPKTKSSK